MQKTRNIIAAFTFMLITLFTHAQEGTTKSGLGETMRSSGRIYVVIAVMLTILIGLILYLVRLDKKITKIEKEL